MIEPIDPEYLAGIQAADAKLTDEDLASGELPLAFNDRRALLAEVARLNDQSNSFAETIRVAGEMVASRDDRINRLTQNHARAAHELDMWLDLHETEAGSARVASAREKLDGASQ